MSWFIVHHDGDRVHAMKVTPGEGGWLEERRVDVGDIPFGPEELREPGEFIYGPWTAVIRDVDGRRVAVVDPAGVLARGGPILIGRDSDVMVDWSDGVSTAVYGEPTWLTSHIPFAWRELMWALDHPGWRAESGRWWAESGPVGEVTRVVVGSGERPEDAVGYAAGVFRAVSGLNDLYRVYRTAAGVQICTRDERPLSVSSSDPEWTQAPGRIGPWSAETLSAMFVDGPWHMAHGPWSAVWIDCGCVVLNPSGW